MHILKPEEVRAIRKEQGLTQAKFAERYAIPLRTLLNWEQGGRVPESSAMVLLHMIRVDPDGTAGIVALVKETERA